MARPPSFFVCVFTLAIAGCAESVVEGSGPEDDSGGAGKDSSTSDGTAKDTGPGTDVGGKDSKVPHTTTADTGSPDTGTPDTGSSDTGDPDTGDFPDFGSTDTGTSTGDGGGGFEIGPFAPGVGPICATDAECGPDACCTKDHKCGVMFAGDCVAF